MNKIRHDDVLEVLSKGRSTMGKLQDSDIIEFIDVVGMGVMIEILVSYSIINNLDAEKVNALLDVAEAFKTREISEDNDYYSDAKESSKGKIDIY